MPGTAAAIGSGSKLVQEVVVLAQSLGLQANTQFRMGRRIWGAERRIDVILTNPLDNKRLGIECKFQRVQGSAEEKIPSTIQDIDAWPIKGIVVFAGDGLRPRAEISEMSRNFGRRRSVLRCDGRRGADSTEVRAAGARDG